MTHFIMLDLETLGTVPGCAVVAIGAAHATQDGYVLDRFYTVVSRESCRTHGLREEAATLDWWDKQAPEARVILSPATQIAAPSLVEALEAFNVFLRRCSPHVEIFGNGSDFDNAILNAAATAAGVRLAWPPFGHRCYRTLKMLTPHVRMARTGTHHNALDDAISQARHLGAVRNELAVTGDRIDAIMDFVDMMAVEYRRQTSRRRFGIRWNSLSRHEALGCAWATYDASVLDGTLSPYQSELTADAARVLVDEDMQHWSD